MRNTIKNHKDFIVDDQDPTARSPYFIIRAKNARFSGDARVGFQATKRTFKPAVQRNRSKRLLRDWVRANEKLLIPDWDYIFIARHAILDATRDEGRDAIRRALCFLKHEHERRTKKSSESK